MNKYLFMLITFITFSNIGKDIWALPIKGENESHTFDDVVQFPVTVHPLFFEKIKPSFPTIAPYDLSIRMA